MKRVVHISNRVNIPRPGEATAGGLDEAISAPPEGYQMVRLGWSGNTTVKSEFDPKTDMHDNVVDGVRYVTIDLPEELYNRFYEGDANGFRWAVNHNRVDVAEYSSVNAKATRKVNEIVANVAASVIQPNDVVIAHDYHFNEIGAELRKVGIKNPIGHFIHTPTVSQAILENLPDAEQQDYIHEILDTLFAYDFVGLQSPRDFTNLYPLISTGNSVNAPGFYEIKQAKNRNRESLDIGVFPVIGLNDLYLQQAKDYQGHPDTKKFLADMRVPDGKADWLGLERLDYTKGLANKADAISIVLMQQANERIGGSKTGAGLLTHYAQVASAGRMGTPAYEREHAAVTQAFSSLKNLHGQHVAHLRTKAVERKAFLGAARGSNGMAVTSLMDGMCLNGMEYTSANRELDNPGALVLSKETGLAYVFGDAAILVDPMRPHDIARGLREAAAMTPSERRAHNDACWDAMSFNSNSRWQNELINATLSGAKAKRGHNPDQGAASAPTAV